MIHSLTFLCSLFLSIVIRLLFSLSFYMQLLVDQSTGQPNQYSNASDLPGVIIYALPPSSSVFDTFENTSLLTTSEWTMELTTSENLECTTAHQSNRVVGVLPETDQNTKMDASLAKPEAEAMSILVFKEEDKQLYHSEEERLLQDQGKSPQKGIMTSLTPSQKEPLPPPQRMNTTKTATVQLNVHLKLAEFALIPSDNNQSICKSRFSYLSFSFFTHIFFLHTHILTTLTHTLSPLSVPLFLSLC